MDNVLDRLTDYSTCEIEDIVPGKMQSHHPKYKKINFFNKGIDTPFQKIWLRLPKVKIITPVMANIEQIKKAISISVAFIPHTNETKKLCRFIEALEKKIQEVVTDHMDKKLSFRSALRSENGLCSSLTLQMPFIKTNDNLVEFTFHLYNHRNKRINIKSIESGSCISAFMELSEVWIDDHKFGCNWNILQMKTYPQFEFAKCLFIDEKIEEIDNNDETECYHCLHCPNSHTTTTYQVHSHFVPKLNVPPISNTHLAPSLPPPPPPLVKKSNLTTKTEPTNRFIPSVGELLKMRNNLKKSINEVEKTSPVNDPQRNLEKELLSTKKKLKSHQEITNKIEYTLLEMEMDNESLVKREKEITQNYKRLILIISKQEHDYKTNSKVPELSTTAL